MESSNSTIGLTSLAAWEADRIIAVGFMARVPGMVGEGKGADLRNDEVDREWANAKKVIDGEDEVEEMK